MHAVWCLTKDVCIYLYISASNIGCITVVLLFLPVSFLLSSYILMLEIFYSLPNFYKCVTTF
jgi:hypothetical protein